MNESSEFAKLLVEALDKGGVKIADLPDSHPKKLFIPEDEVPETLRQDIVDAMRTLQEFDIPLPFVHVTSGAVKLENGSIVSTGFIDNITTNGTNPNINVAAFVERHEGELSKIAKPQYFIDHPDQFIEDIHLMLKRYKKHGMRVNKDSLKNIRHKYEGLPTSLIINGSDVLTKRGVDGDEHYVLLSRIKAQDIIGTLPLDTINADNRDEVLTYSSQLLSLTRSYIGKNRSSD